MKKQRETLTGKEQFGRENFPAANLKFMFLKSPQCRMLSPSHPSILFVQKDCVCGRFLSVASLQGLLHEGTMTSLCLAMTGEQQKAVVIDCSSSQPQFYNAGEPQPLGRVLGLLAVSVFALRTNGTNLPFLPCAVLHVYPNSPKKQQQFQEHGNHITPNNSTPKYIEKLLYMYTRRQIKNIHKGIV